MNKEHNILLLATDNESNYKIAFCKGIAKQKNKLFFFGNNSGKHKTDIPQNLYITSDEQIKEGDWFIHSSHDVSRVFKAKSVETGEQGSIITIEGDACWYINCKKIIATTDTSINIELFHQGDKLALSQIPQEYIQYYVKKYNEGVILEKCEVEYELVEGTIFSIEDGWDKSPVALKLNTDNTINIVIPEEKELPHCYCDKDPFECKCSEEKMYSREEVENILKEYREYCWINGVSIHELNKWIKENLK